MIQENTAVISPQSSVPLYRQLAALLRRQIEQHQLAPGERIPSEAEIGRQYSISRITVRQALAELERDGLVQRVPGKGTFVHGAGPHVQALTRLSSFRENSLASGVTPGYRVIDIGWREGPVEEASVFGDESLYLVYRVLLADGVSIGTSRSLLPSWLVQLAPERFSRDNLMHNSLYTAMEAAGATPDRAEEVVGPDIADAEEAGLLAVPEGSLLLQVERLTYDTSGRPIEHVTDRYDRNRYSYRIELHRSHYENSTREDHS